MICGVGDYTAILAEHLSRIPGVNVDVLTGKEARTVQSADSPGGVNVHPHLHDWGFSEMPRLIAKVRALRSDVVHIQYPTLGYGNSWMPYFLPLVLRAFGIKVVQTWHEPPTRFRFFPNAITKDRLVFVEPDFVQRVRARYRALVARKKHAYIPVASNIPRIISTPVEREIVRARFVTGAQRMVVFFGFIYPRKRVEVLFDIAESSRDTLVLISHLDDSDEYHSEVQARIKVWPGKVIVTGNLPAEEVAKVLHAADAAVFPFADGVDFRNASVLAAKAQGTYVITTSRERSGMDENENVFYAAPNDIEAMKKALANAAGPNAGRDINQDWEEIARQHLDLYRSVIDDRTAERGVRGGS
jgi:glycosyltransferase involved in cell wall biosynthesis